MTAPTIRRDVTFADNRLAQLLFGDYDRHLVLIESELGLRIGSRGNTVDLEGGEGAVRQAERVLLTLYQRLEQGDHLDSGAVRGVLRTATRHDATYQLSDDAVAIRTQRKWIRPRTEAQARYIHALRSNKLIFGIGPAGTGKTYLAVAAAVAAMASGEVDRLILSRPAVEAGERIGFLPGDMREKVDPYLQPLYDALYDMLPSDLVEKRIEAGQIEIAPIAFMRGRTLARSFVILDEAQNTSKAQMMMFLTRFGENSRMVVAGDPEQVDLPANTQSGLSDAVGRLHLVNQVAVQHFGPEDVVRDPLVADIIRAYNDGSARSPLPPRREG